MNQILNIGKIFSIGLVIFIISYLAYNYFGDSKHENKTDVRLSKEVSTNIETKIEERTKSSTVPPIRSGASNGDDIVAYGLKLLGTPYVEAGCSKDGFDCSGFVYFVFQHHKIDVPRSTSDYENFGTEIPLANVQKGDLLLFLSPTRDVIGHIGIVSNPKGIHSDFLHSTSGKEMQVTVTNLSKTGYAKRFVKAIRVL